jgi:molecular chaperone GrpE
MWDKGDDTLRLEKPAPEALPAGSTDTPAPQPAAPVGEGEAASEIERLTAQVAELQDKYLRALAELENFRRRMQREQARHFEYANERLLRELLPVVDDLEQALANRDVPAETLRKGVELVLQKLRQTLAAFGAEPFDALHQPFDPYLHEAVERVVNDELAEGTIVAELQRGYKYRGRLLRPARVVVSVPSCAQSSEEGKAE